MRWQSRQIQGKIEMKGEDGREKTKRFSLPSKRLLQFGTEQEVSEEKNMA